MEILAKDFVVHKGLRMVCFSYLTGSEIYHKIALLNHFYRERIPNNGLLDQHKELRQVAGPTIEITEQMLKYALQFADAIQVVFKNKFYENAVKLCRLL